MNDLARTLPEAEIVPEPQELIVSEQSSGILAVISRAATDPNIDIDKMERLLEMQTKLLERAAKEAFSRALAQTQAEIPVIKKDSHNGHTQSNYASFGAINAVLMPIYAKHGFSLSFGTNPSTIENHLQIFCNVSHEQGHTEHYSYDLPYDGAGLRGNANKSPIHASASTVSYGQRYLTTMIFNVATSDDDALTASTITLQPSGITEETVDEIIKGLDITGKTQQGCLDYINLVSGNEYDRLTQFSEKEGQRLLYKLNKSIDGEQS